MRIQKTRLVGALVALFFLGVTTQLSAQSRTGSKAASELLVGGSELVLAGSVDLLQGGGGLVVTSAVKTGKTVKLVLAPVARGVSGAADFSKTLVVEISVEAWEIARASASAGAALAGELVSVVGATVEAVALTTSVVGVAASTVAASAVVLGYVLVVEGIVIGVVALPVLEPLLGHRVHTLAVSQIRR